MQATHPNTRLIRDFYEVHARYYAGGEIQPVSEMLTDDIAWHVPGRSPIAGHYHGKQEVLEYFRARSERASGSFRIEVRDVLANDQRAVVLAGGRATRDGQTLTWETAGVFRIADGKIAECWLLPFDQYEFDEIWS
jgi:ketosteroid isomerase-like protein